MEDYIEKRIEYHKSKRIFCNEHDFLLEAKLHNAVVEELERVLFLVKKTTPPCPQKK